MASVLSASKTFTTTEVASHTGASVRQLNWWWMTGRIPRARGTGKGIPRRWTTEQRQVAWDLAHQCIYCGGTGKRI